MQISKKKKTTWDQDSKLENSHFLTAPHHHSLINQQEAFHNIAALGHVRREGPEADELQAQVAVTICVLACSKQTMKLDFVADCNWLPPLQQRHYATIRPKTHFITDIKK